MKNLMVITLNLMRKKTLTVQNQVVSLEISAVGNTRGTHTAYLQ